MHSKLSLSVENGILRCFITGERSTEETLLYWRDIIIKCDNEGIQYILYTIALRDKFHPLDAIKIYQKLIDLVKSTNLQIAIMDLNHLSAKDSQVATNMGASQGLNIAYFDQETQALEWLMKSKQANKNHVNLANNHKEQLISV